MQTDDDGVLVTLIATVPHVHQMIHRQTMRRSGGSSRQGRALFSFLFFEKLVNSLVSRVILKHF